MIVPVRGVFAKQSYITLWFSRIENVYYHSCNMNYFVRKWFPKSLLQSRSSVSLQLSLHSIFPCIKSHMAIERDKWNKKKTDIFGVHIIKGDNLFGAQPATLKCSIFSFVNNLYCNEYIYWLSVSDFSVFSSY